MGKGERGGVDYEFARNIMTSIRCNHSDKRAMGLQVGVAEGLPVHPKSVRPDFYLRDVYQWPAAK